MPTPFPKDKLATGLLIGLLAYVTLTGVWEAAHRPFWFDEVFTAVLAEKPSLRETFAALRAGVDTSGPGYYVIQRVASGVTGDPHVALRLPSILATALVAWVLFQFARRDLDPAPSLVAVFIVLASQLYHGYSVEARPYALMVLGVAVAMLAWQRADARGWTAALAISAAAAVSVHYYAIFALAPLALAEAVATLRTRTWRWGVWAALAGSGATLFLLWSQLSALRDYYGENYWSTPTIGKALATYDTVSGLGPSGGGLGLALAVTLLLAAAAIQGWRSSAAERWPNPETFALVLGLIGLPFLVVAATWIMDGGYAERYALAVVPGLALGGAYAAGAIERRHQPWLVAAMLCVFGARELAFWGDGTSNLGLRQAPPMNAQREVVALADAMDLPLVVANPVDFLPFSYYHQDPPIDIVGLVDHEAALSHAGTDSVERDLEIIRPHLPLRIESWSAFTAEHASFLLLSRPGPFTWATPLLLDRGFTLSALRQSGPSTLFAVRRRGP